MIIQGQLLLRTKGPVEWTEAYFVLAVEERILYCFGDDLDIPRAILQLRDAAVGDVEEQENAFRFSLRVDDAAPPVAAAAAGAEVKFWPS